MNILKHDKIDIQIAKLIGAEFDTVCNGEIGELPYSSDGWFCLECGHQGNWGDSFEHARQLQPYSSSIATTWEVIEILTEGVIQFRLEIAAKGSGHERYYAKFVDCKTGKVYGGSAKTAPLAICRAALEMKSE